MSQETREPSVIAAINQLGARMVSTAEVLGSFFRALIDEGFESDEAMVLVRDYFAGYEPIAGVEDAEG